MRFIPNYRRREGKPGSLIRRVLVAGIATVVVVSLAWRFFPTLKFAWLQQTCLNYRHPPNQPVFVQTDLDLFPQPDTLCFPLDPEWRSVTLVPAEYPDRRLATAYYEPRPYRQYLNAIPSSGRMVSKGGIVFLHRRRAPNSEERLVVVGVFPNPCFGMVAANLDDPRGYDDTLELHIWAVALSVGSSGKNVVLEGDQFLPVNLGSVKRWQRLCVFGGNPDPADPAHFTIRYAVDGREGMLEGWLQADGTIVIKPQARVGVE